MIAFNTKQLSKPKVIGAPRQRRCTPQLKSDQRSAGGQYERYKGGVKDLLKKYDMKSLRPREDGYRQTDRHTPVCFLPQKDTLHLEDILSQETIFLRQRDDRLAQLGLTTHVPYTPAPPVAR
ncbi:hypothetical protein AAFF_G00393270 [Aldrovandia affinis]|uniref:Uncharacterized protein n=1 Tax=Aldrovandia affinis TaxID=143900 RepID=A0AAD7WKU7_9TELE|nr:hypothetical protein AAFF_G00393270 [Aldrovandia affinis]